MNIGFIGLGHMGQAMARRLLDAKIATTVYNRSPGKTAEFESHGAKVAKSVRDLAAKSDIIVTMLANDAALDETAHGDEGLLATMRADSIHVAMGTHSATLVQALEDAHKAKKQVFVSAPVLGRPEAVVAGKLAIVAGGPDAALARCKPVFEALGRKTFVAGPTPASAAVIKVANNFLLACAIEAMGEAFSLTERFGVPGDVFRDVVTDGLFACPAYVNYSRMIAQKDFDTVGFTATLGLKDIKLALAAGETAGVPLPSGNVVRDRLVGAIAHGDGEADWVSMAREQGRASRPVK